MIGSDNFSESFSFRDRLEDCQNWRCPFISYGVVEDNRPEVLFGLDSLKVRVEGFVKILCGKGN